MDAPVRSYADLNFVSGSQRFPCMYSVFPLLGGVEMTIFMSANGLALFSSRRASGMRQVSVFIIDGLGGLDPVAALALFTSLSMLPRKGNHTIPL